MSDHFSKELILLAPRLVLYPLCVEHYIPLAQLAESKQIWQYAPYPFYQAEVFKQHWFDKALQQIQNQERYAFVICYQNHIVGSSSYYHIDEANKTIAIGYTWLQPDFWQQNVNALVKLVMLQHAIEAAGYMRVAFYVDKRNQRSCKALQRLAIHYEGICRNHFLLPDGTARDSAIFSVTSKEWPSIKFHLQKITSIIKEPLCKL